jgi:hypothetical protein
MFALAGAGESLLPARKTSCVYGDEKSAAEAMILSPEQVRVFVEISGPLQGTEDFHAL